MDNDGYPTEEELQKIETWPSEDPAGWFAFIKACGNYWSDTSPYMWSEGPGVVLGLDTDKQFYWISTGGWSGNESILTAMEKNWMLWNLTWYSHRRGGHYQFIKAP